MEHVQLCTTKDLLRESLKLHYCQTVSMWKSDDALWSVLWAFMFRSRLRPRWMSRLSNWQSPMSHLVACTIYNIHHYTRHEREVVVKLAPSGGQRSSMNFEESSCFSRPIKLLLGFFSFSVVFTLCQCEKGQGFRIISHRIQISTELPFTARSGDISSYKMAAVWYANATHSQSPYQLRFLFKLEPANGRWFPLYVPGFLPP